MRTLSRATAAALVSMALAMPALAQGTTMSAQVATSADLACMSAAVDAREAATITARATFHARIMAALDVRRAAFKAAYTIANTRDRQVALQAAISAYAKATADARAKFEADVKAAWSAFATAKVGCHIDQDAPPRAHDDDEKKHKKANRGLHLGWLKNSLHSKA